MSNPVDSPPRRFALLGYRADVPEKFRVDEWREAIQSSDDHEIVAVALGLDPEVPSYRDWLSLCEISDRFDAILISRTTPEVVEALGPLAARGLTLLIPGYRGLPTELIAELSLYDAEGIAAVIPLCGSRLHDLLERLHDIIADGLLGEIIKIESKHHLSSDRLTPPHSDLGMNLLFDDVLMFRLLGGDYSQVNLLRTAVRGHRFATQILTLSGGGLPDATSIIDVSADTNPFRLCVEGDLATAVICRSEDDTLTYVLKIGGDVVAEQGQWVTNEQRLKMIDNAAMRKPGALVWRDVVRTNDVMEAARRSLRRRRTIDLHFEPTSERNEFKTKMAAIGCGVILWTMFGIIGLLLAGAVLDPRDGMQREAESAGFVLRNDEFQPDNAVPTKPGADHIRAIGERLNLNESVVFIESSGDEKLDESRIQTVRESLAQPLANEEGRVVARTLRGQWFAQAMQVARVLVFAPVGVFLLFQALLLIARPASQDS